MSVVLLFARLGLSAVFLVTGLARLPDLAGSVWRREDFPPPRWDPW